jgi:ABC-type bacteriocin/lantibiotic exporter with double-glycine peptidase domain
MSHFFKFFFSNSKNYVLLAMVICVAVFELVSVGLIYPLIYLLTGNEPEKNYLIDQLIQLIEFLGISTDKTYLVIYIVTLLVLKALFILVYYTFSISSLLNYMNELRKKMFWKLVESSYSSVSNQVSRVTNAMTIQSHTAAGALFMGFQIIQNIFVLIASITIACIVSWKLFLFVTTIVCLIGLAAKFTLPKSEKFGHRLVELNKRLYNNIMQMMTSIKYIKAVEAYDTIYRALLKTLKGIYKNQLKFGMLNRGTDVVSEPISIFILGLILLIGISLKLQPELLLIQALIMYRIFPKILPFIGMLQKFRSQSASIYYCENLIDDLEGDKQAGDGRSYRYLKKEIEFSGIDFKYDNRIIFNNLSFNIPSKKITLFMGESGAGKTTILGLLTGLLKAEEGKILIDGAELGEYDLKSVRQKIGLVMQESPLFNLSIRENLCLRDGKISDSELIENLREFSLENLFPRGEIDLDYVIDENASNLSGGQKQRLALIRELLVKPDILILDEATSALDDYSKERIIQYIKMLSGRMTIIIVSHQKEYMDIADNIYSIEDHQAVVLKDKNSDTKTQPVKAMTDEKR